MQSSERDEASVASALRRLKAGSGTLLAPSDALGPQPWPPLAAAT